MRSLKGIPAEQVVAVSCTGQWASTIPVDEAGEPVGPCVMWLDTRGRPPLARASIGGPLMGYSPRALATWIRHTGGVPSPFGGDPVSHMLHLERDEPEIAAAARWYLEPVDYLTMRFTGRAAATHASMSGAWLTDNRRLDRLEYDPMLVGKLGLDAAKLPPLVQTGSMIGRGPPGGGRPSSASARAHRSSRARRICIRRRSAAEPSERASRTSRSAPHPGSRCRSRARRRTRSTRSRPFRGWTRRAISSRTTTRPPGSACAGCATASPLGRAGGLRAPDRAR